MPRQRRVTDCIRLKGCAVPVVIWSVVADRMSFRSRWVVSLDAISRIMGNYGSGAACRPYGASLGTHTPSPSARVSGLAARRNANKSCCNVARPDRHPGRRCDAERPAGKSAQLGIRRLRTATGRLRGRRIRSWSSISTAIQFAISGSGPGRAISSPGWWKSRQQRGLSALTFCSRSPTGSRQRSRHRCDPCRQSASSACRPRCSRRPRW